MGFCRLFYDEVLIPVKGKLTERKSCDFRFFKSLIFIGKNLSDLHRIKEPI
jgi:hypothetical protein